MKTALLNAKEIIAKARKHDSTKIMIMDSQLTEIPDELWDLTHLEAVVLDYGGNHLPDSIGKLINLKRLRLVMPNLSEIPEVLWSMDSLESLVLEDTALCAIPAGIGKLSNLNKLTLIGNNLLTTLPHELTALTKLQHLYVDSPSLTSIPPMGEIGILSDEIPIGLTHIAIINTALTQLPNGYLTDSLYELNLEKNRLTSLPDNIGECHNLITLDVSDNQLTSLPPSFTNLRHLVHLVLAKNPLTQLPEDIGKLQQLRYLNIDDTYITELPSQIRLLHKLKPLVFNLPIKSRVLPQSEIAELKEIPLVNTLATLSILVDSIPMDVHILAKYDGVKELVGLDSNTLFLWYDLNPIKESDWIQSNSTESDPPTELWLKIVPHDKSILIKHLSNLIGVLDVINHSSVELYERTHNSFLKSKSNWIPSQSDSTLARIGTAFESHQNPIQLPDNTTLGYNFFHKLLDY